MQDRDPSQCGEQSGRKGSRALGRTVTLHGDSWGRDRPRLGSCLRQLQGVMSAWGLLCVPSVTALW